jgi:hypothetical protein
MSGHTPGPWIARNWSCHSPTTVMTENPRTPRETVAECSGNGEQFGTDVCVANARLIAAAPDLLAALQMAVRNAGHRPSEPWFIAGNIAISKATGVSHA